MLVNERLRFRPRSVYDDESLAVSLPPRGILSRLPDRIAEIYYRSAYGRYQEGYELLRAMGATPEPVQSLEVLGVGDNSTVNYGMLLSSLERVHIPGGTLWF